MATVQGAVKESLLGSTREPELSTQTKATFDTYAKRDEATGELFMTEHEFIDAIAPDGEDYVSYAISMRWCSGCTDSLLVQLAQNKTRAIRNTFPDRGPPQTWAYQPS